MREIIIKTNGRSYIVESFDSHSQSGLFREFFFYSNGEIGMRRFSDRHAYDYYMSGCNCKEYETITNENEKNRVLNRFSLFLEDLRHQSNPRVFDEDLKALNIL